MSRGRFNLKLKLNVYILSAATIIYCITIGYISYRLNDITYNNSVEIVKGSGVNVAGETGADVG